MAQNGELRDPISVIPRDDIAREIPDAWKGLVYDKCEGCESFTSRSWLTGERLVRDLVLQAASKRDAMSFQPSRHVSYGAGIAHGQARQMARSSFSIIPHSPRPVRTASFIFGRSDSRLRPLLNQEERDRMHCWAMIIALASSAAGTTLLLMAALY